MAKKTTKPVSKKATAPKKEAEVKEEKKVFQIIKGKHELTEAEQLEIGKRLSDCIGHKAQLEAQLKENSAGMRSQIKTEQEAINTFTDKLRTGEEERDFRCIVTKDFDKREKTFTDEKTGRVIKVQPFTAIDYQLDLIEEEGIEPIEEEANGTDENEEEN